MLEKRRCILPLDIGDVESLTAFAILCENIRVGSAWYADDVKYTAGLTSSSKSVGSQKQGS